MRQTVLFCFCAMLAAGCASKKAASPGALAQPDTAPNLVSQAAQTSGTDAIVTPATQLQGSIVLVNAKARYVIVSFPIGSLPELDRQMHVYRNGLKVAELKITGPKRDFNIAADIAAGECQIGDEVRENESATP